MMLTGVSSLYSAIVRRSVRFGERCEILLVQRIDGSPSEPLGGRPDIRDRIDDGGAAREAREQVRTARPILHDDAVILENSVKKAGARLALATACLRLGPVRKNRGRGGAVAPVPLTAKNSAQRAHRKRLSELTPIRRVPPGPLHPAADVAGGNRRQSRRRCRTSRPRAWKYSRTPAPASAAPAGARKRPGGWSS